MTHRKNLCKMRCRFDGFYSALKVISKGYYLVSQRMIWSNMKIMTVKTLFNSICTLIFSFIQEFLFLVLFKCVLICKKYFLIFFWYLRNPLLSCLPEWCICWSKFRGGVPWDEGGKKFMLPGPPSWPGKKSL